MTRQIPSRLISNPVWQSCPPICSFEMLPAFETMKALNEFMEQSHLVIVSAKWKCPKCRMYHAKSVGISRASASGIEKQVDYERKTQAERDGYNLENLK